MAIVGQVVRALTKNDKAKIEKMLQVSDSDTTVLKSNSRVCTGENKPFCIFRDWAEDTTVLVSMSIFYS